VRLYESVEVAGVDTIAPVPEPMPTDVAEANPSAGGGNLDTESGRHACQREHRAFLRRDVLHPYFKRKRLGS